jgi:RNA-directed DNA polymerase
MLDELDKELEKRGHRFVRYADDSNIYVKSERAGQRVYESIKRYLETKLKLKVNEEKSAVDRPERRKFLGITFSKNKNGKPDI